MLPRPPRIILALTLLISAGLAVSAAYGLWSALSGQIWAQAGFEALLLIAGVFGALTGLGKFREGPAMALICAAGAGFVGAGLAFLTRGGRPPLIGVDMLLAMLTDPIAGARLGGVAGLAALAGLIVLLRRPAASFRYVGLSAATGAPVALAGALWILGPGRSAFVALHPLLRAVVGAAAFLAVIGLATVSLHCLIRAFEQGREDEPPEQTPQTSAAQTGS